VIFEGTDGYVVVPSYDGGTAFDKDGNQVATFNSGSDANHFTNFLNAVRSRKLADLNADIEEGHLSSALCHTGNVSHRLGEKRTAAEIRQAASGNALLAEATDRLLTHLRANDVDVDSPTVTLGPWLELDPKSERFVNNESANHFVRREDRKPFVVPQIA
jgi:hypothetical protein